MFDEILDKIEIKKLRKTILFLSISTFVISLTQDCYCMPNDCVLSIFAFLFGFFGVLSGVVSWFANPALIYSWINIKDNEKATLLSVLSLFLAGIFMVYQKVGSNEAGHTSEIVSYKLGYWLWLVSILITFIGNLLIGRKLNIDKKKSQINYSKFL